MHTNDPIWILDSDPVSVALYHQTLGLQYPLKIFSNFEDFSAAYKQAAAGQPKLLIAEPQDTQGSLAKFFQSFATSDESHFPETFIVSHIDELDFIRFFLRVGVRDYLLKPLRSSELIAKIERALMKMNSRSVLIFKNDLDGKHVPNLTFRENQILTMFLNRANRLIERDHLIDAVWSQTTVNRKTLDVHLFNLRRKIRPLGYDIVSKKSELYLAKVSSSTRRKP